MDAASARKKFTNQILYKWFRRIVARDWKLIVENGCNISLGGRRPESTSLGGLYQKCYSSWPRRIKHQRTKGILTSKVLIWSLDWDQTFGREIFIGILTQCGVLFPLVKRWEVLGRIDLGSKLYQRISMVYLMD